MEKWQHRRTWIIIGAIALVVLICGGILLAQQRQMARATEEQYRSHIIQRGSLGTLVSATGSLEPTARSELAFLASGQVLEVLVERGDEVDEGQLLARLDTSDLELALEDAETTQRLQEIAFDQLTAGAGEYDLTASRAAVYGAAAQLQQLLQGPDPEAVQVAQLNLEVARNALWISQISRDRIRYNEGESVNWSLACRQVDRDQMTVNIAEQQLINAQQGVDQYEIAGARAAVAQAQAALNLLLEGPDEVDLALAEVQIEQAALAVEQARLALADAEIHAPFAGTVAELRIEAGELVGAGTSVIVLMNNREVQLDVLVDEIDVAQIVEGQSATIMLDALPEAEVEGTVTFVAPNATVEGGVVSYRVVITLEPTDAPIRVGMTGTAGIVTEVLEDVLLVPNWAVRLDRTTGEAFVNIRRENGRVEEVAIELGMYGNEFSEVLSGLEEGDEVVVMLGREAFFEG